ncbi:MAG: ribosome hibernation-promoting factor, HPF/YfiA family [Phenylobacterium sp.]
MQVQVSGKHIAVGDALKSRITDDLNTSIGRYFERGGINAEVIVHKDGPGFCAECVVRLASGQQLDSHGSGPDAHAAFDAALSKLETRVRRYKRRLKNHHRAAGREASETAQVVVLRAPEAEEADGVWDDLGESELVSHEPPSGVVIAETQAELRTMTVSMAVMALDLTESQTIVFRNAAHGGLSVVYRRPDGNIGWIDPERTKPMRGADVPAANEARRA